MGAGILDTMDNCENVACKAVVDLVISQRASELFLSPCPFVLSVTVANAEIKLCDVGRTKR